MGAQTVFEYKWLRSTKREKLREKADDHCQERVKAAEKSQKTVEELYRAEEAAGLLKPTRLPPDKECSEENGRRCSCCCLRHLMSVEIVFLLPWD